MSPILHVVLHVVLQIDYPFHDSPSEYIKVSSVIYKYVQYCACSKHECAACPTCHQRTCY